MMQFKWDSTTCSYCGEGHNYHITGTQGPGKYAVFIFRGYSEAVIYEYIATLPTLDQAKQWCEIHHMVGADTRS